MPARDALELRPLREDDLRTVWSWRNSDRIRAVSVHDREIPWEEHVAWFERSKTDRSRQAMLFEREGKPTGVVNFVDIDREAGSAAWGFYLGDVDAPKGSASAMGFLALDYAFDTLGLRRITGKAFASNDASLRYHRRLGFVELEERREQIERGEGEVDLLHFELSSEGWRERRPSLEEKLFRQVNP